jgi:hypothetical protein
MSESEKVLLAKLDHFVEKIRLKDISIVDDLWGDGGFLMAGSERGEICWTRPELAAKLMAVFSNPATLVFDWPRRKVNVVDNVGWIFAEGDVVIGSATGETRQPYLVSCIFEKVGDTWHWRQFFGSEPA